MNNEEQVDQPISESLDFSRPDFVFRPNENHGWKQKGPYLVCKTCDILHATYIGPDKIMVGLDSAGKPLFKIRSQIG